MCQESPGPRCWADSCKTAASYKRRLEASTSKLKDNKQKLVAAERAGDFSAYARLRTARTKLMGNHQGLMKDARWNQRDVDGTKKGAAVLEAELASATDEKVQNKLLERKAQADALRFARQTALDFKHNPRKPMFFIKEAA